jgi:bifunctional DNA-binding transcriptional regulator/antitoxin component of YhaV-PrlF toxin-antitoxin module
LRRQLGIEPGSQLAIDNVGDSTIQLKVLNRGPQGLSGLLHRPGRPVVTLEDMEAAVTLAVTERNNRSKSRKP